jgi:hypothetical protein
MDPAANTTLILSLYISLSTQVYTCQTEPFAFWIGGFASVGTPLRSHNIELTFDSNGIY